MTTAAVMDRRILVSTDSVEDGQQIVRLLKDDFANVRLSSQSERAAADFDLCLPDVLVLAFDKLENAQRYYLGLYRLSRSVHAHPHRTVLLCSKDEVRAAFDLCKKDYFDDYVLHWPHAHDGRRLSMSVWIASMFPLALASHRPLLPSAVVTPRSAPSSINARSSPTCPLALASRKGVIRSHPRCSFGSAPLRRGEAASRR